MLTMLILSALLVALYVGATIWSARKLPDSVSAIVYMLPRAGQWAWTVWVWAVSMLLLPSLMEVMPEDLKVLGFLTVGAMLFIGAMPLVRNEKNTAHYVLAIAAGILSQVCVAILSSIWLTAWMLFPFLMGSVYVQPWGWLGKAMTGKGVFVAEAVCWLTLTGCLIESIT